MKTPFVLYAIAGAIGAHATANFCDFGFFPGSIQVQYTTPYTYSQVMSIIGDFQNLTWSGTPEGSVKLNGTTNTVGTARTYDVAGGQVIETLTTYSKPPNGPYEEVHTVGRLHIAIAGVSVYADHDGMRVEEICNGAASAFTLTTNFCANNPYVAGGLLYALHLTNVENVGKLLGGQLFTSCAAIKQHPRRRRYLAADSA